MIGIEVDNITVEYTLYGVRTTSLQRDLMRRVTGGRVFSETGQLTRVRALDGVSFTLNEGDRLGLIGPNGAGKSTLIRLLAGCLEPVSGSMKISGKVTALLTIGTGMDPERTGRDNIMHMGLYHLILPKQMESFVESIIEFAELGDFIDLPVRTYSDGMRLRLAFAIATCITPEVLIMDERIGAGDAHFAEKAQQRAMSLYHSARVIVMASHNSTLLKKLCNKGLLLEQGQAKMFGPIDDVIAAYAAAA